MPYNESFAKCDWCSRLVDDGADVACGKCYSQVEGELSDAQQEIERLKERIAKLEGML